MPKEKICPLMLIGLIANTSLEIAPTIIAIQNKHIDILPKCLKENCRLWVRESFAGSLHGEKHCGLIKRG